MINYFRVIAAAATAVGAADARGGATEAGPVAGYSIVRANALIAEDSTYLRSLASSRIEWRAWGPDACAEAKASGKPIFLSIGYASCLWSARMDRGVFSDGAVAGRLNAACVPVKVDRFEHPDLDRWCQRAVEAAGQPGGWPLNVWMSPEGLPIRAVTSPSPDEDGPAGFLTQINHFRTLWTADAAYLSTQAGRDARTLEQRVGAALGGEVRIDADLLARARGQTLSQLDPVHGGFGRVPKFATPARLSFLLRQAGASGPVPAQSNPSLAAVTLSLDALARSGLRDHVGGGFFRYAQDEGWTRPYFEKLALDQALLADAFLSAHRMTGNPTYAEVARDTLGYALRELSHPDGGFFTGEQCESHRPSQGLSEGAFYLWTASQFAEAIGSEAPLLAAICGIRESGNLPPGSGPTALMKGANLPVPDLASGETVARFGVSPESLEATWRAGRAALREAQARQPRPALDRLMISQTCAAFISTLSRASLQLGEPGLLDRARHAAGFLESSLWDAQHSRLRRACLDRPSRLPGVADDYAYFVRALLDLHETTGESRWLVLADAVQQGFDRECGDVAAGGWFDTARSAGRGLSLKSIDDAGGFSPNAVAGANAVRWSVLLADPTAATTARRALEAFAAPLNAGSPSVAGLFGVAHSLVHPPRRIVLFGNPDHPELRDARARLAAAPDGHWCVLSVDSDQALEWLIRRGALPRDFKDAALRAPTFLVDGDASTKEIARSLQELHKFL